MSASLRKRKANRANAKKSTGPTTAAGREKVSHNSVNHGLCGRFYVLPCENQDDYDLLLQRLHEEEKPAGTAEIELVVKMAQHTWLCRRALGLQEACFSMEPPTPGQTREQHAVGVRTTIDNYVRYHAAQDRAYRRASQELLQRRKERQLAERGFASQKRLEAEETRKAEKHAQTMALQKAQLHVAEIRAAKAMAAMLPPDYFNHSTSGQNRDGYGADVYQNQDRAPQPMHVFASATSRPARNRK